MFRFMKRFGRDSQARGRGTGPINRARRRNHQLNCEALESRQMLSGYYIVNNASGKVLDNPGGSPYNGQDVDQWQLTGGTNQQWNLVGQGNGLFQLVNAQNGQVIGDPGSSPYNGTQVIQWQSNPGLNEQWTFVPAGDGPAVTNYVANGANGKVLDNSLSTSEGTGVIQWQLNGGANQRWTFVPLADGNDLIVNYQSGLVLDDPGGSTNWGGIDQWQLNGDMNQQWQIAPVGGTYSSTILNAASNLRLADPNSDQSNGTVVIQYPPDGGTEQQWVLLAAGNAAPVTYYVVEDGRALADPSGSTQSPTNLILWQELGSVEQKWTFVQLADSNDLIVNEASGDVVDGSGGRFRDGQTYVQGAAIYQSQITGSLGQQWQLVGLSDGNYNLINASSRFALDDPNYYDILPFAPDGVDSWPTNGGPNQEWTLYQVSVGVDIHGQPSNAVVGQPISPAIAVAVVDANGNTITTDNTQLVTLAIASGPAGAKLQGTTTVRAVNGVADFTNLSLSLPGTYTLTATGGALTPDSSNKFTIAPATVASHVTIHRGSVHKVGRTSPRGSGGELMAQTITIKNAGRQPLGGPLALLVGSLPSGVTLANATGTYEGGSYRDVLAALQPLAPGKSVTVTLDFSMTGRRSPSLSKLHEDLEALLGI